MQFVADSQFVFTVWAAGKQKMVSFGNRNAEGVASFITNDEIVAQAVRNTKYFKQGRIKEVIKETAKADTIMPEKQSAVKTTVFQEEKADTENTAASPENTDIKTFTSITFAKNYLAKEFGVDKKALKTPEQVIASAEANGIKIKF